MPPVFRRSWAHDQILFQRFDRRLAAFLLDESAVEGTDELESPMSASRGTWGSAREVVTRMLKYFQSDELVCALARRRFALIDRKRLRELAK
jgi:CRP/FNR family transcriptional regulator